MKTINAIIWRVVQLIILPLAVYAAIFFNGLPFEVTQAQVSNYIFNMLSWISSSSSTVAFANTLAFIPASIAYLMPAGFTANAYLFGIFIDRDLILLLIFLFFVTTRAPKLPMIGSRKQASYA